VCGKLILHILAFESEATWRIGQHTPASVMQFRTHFRFETAGALQAG